MYKLNIHPGSGWNGANFLLSLRVPKRDKYPERWIVLEHFRTEKEAEEALKKMAADLDQQARALGPVVQVAPVD